MSKKQETSAHTRSWRALKQTSKNRAVTFQAKKKRLQIAALYSLYGVLVLGFLAVAAGAVYVYKTSPSLFYTGGSSTVVKQIHFDTDGVLTRAWVSSKLGVTSDSGLMTIDIHELDKELEAEGQVKSATVMRSFPDALIVEVEEYEPAFRLMASERGKSKEMLVSAEGVVYEGYNYHPLDLKQLPWLAGVRLKKGPNGYEKLAAVPLVSELFKTAQRDYSYLVSDWFSIDCKDFDGRSDVAWAVIRVKTRRTGELVFVPKNFDQQLVRLDGILSSMDLQEYPKIKRIDLSLSDHSAVKLADSGYRKGARR